VQHAGRSNDLCSISAAGVSSTGVSSLAVLWEKNVVNNNSPVTASRSVRSTYVANRKAFVGFGIAAIGAGFLLLSNSTALTPFNVLDYRHLACMRFSGCLLILVDL